MIYIKKNEPPGEFIRYAKSSGACFDGMDSAVKATLRTALLQEQKYLCAYCMTSLEDLYKYVKIEHYVPRDADNELAYKNLLAVCCGNAGKPKTAQTCDTRKGNTILQIDPQNQHHMADIFYDGNGKIYIKNKEWQADLDDVLNLNCPELQAGRKAALDGLCAVLYKENKAKSASKAYLEKRLKFYQEGKDGRLRSYCGILRYYLQKRIRQCR